MYRNAHVSMYGPGRSARTRKQGCTWTSGANGVDAATGGLRTISPDAVLAKVKPSEETNPATPGWSMVDLALAMTRLGVPFAIRTNQGWDAVEQALDDRLYVVLQGDSDQFSNDTCSGVFDGTHAIGVHPERDGDTHPINDPVCSHARRETRAVLRKYATKFNPKISFGVFLTPVPGGDMTPLPITSLQPMLVDAPAQTPCFDLDGKTQLTKLQAALVDQFSPYGYGAFRAIAVTTRGAKRQVLIAPSRAKAVPPY